MVVIIRTLFSRNGRVNDTFWNFRINHISEKSVPKIYHIITTTWTWAGSKIFTNLKTRLQKLFPGNHLSVQLQKLLEPDDFDSQSKLSCLRLVEAAKSRKESVWREMIVQRDFQNDFEDHYKLDYYKDESDPDKYIWFLQL